jgi:hypothetical protein
MTNAPSSFQFALAVVCAGLSAVIAGKKDRDTIGFLIVGFLVGPIGVIVAAVAAPGRSSPGRRRRASPRRKWGHFVHP